MAILLFSLRGVPEDEAQDVRELLAGQGIDFYETSAGNWGISMPALWLREHGQWQQAQHILADYQRQRYLNARERYVAEKGQGKQASTFQAFCQHPLKHCLYWLCSGLILYVSVKLVFELGL